MKYACKLGAPLKHKSDEFPAQTGSYVCTFDMYQVIAHKVRAKFLDHAPCTRTATSNTACKLPESSTCIASDKFSV